MQPAFTREERLPRLLAVGDVDQGRADTDDLASLVPHRHIVDFEPQFTAVAPHETALDGPRQWFPGQLPAEHRAAGCPLLLPDELPYGPPHHLAICVTKQGALGSVHSANHCVLVQFVIRHGSAVEQVAELGFACPQSVLRPLTFGDVPQKDNEPSAFNGPVLEADFDFEGAPVLAAVSGLETGLALFDEPLDASGGLVRRLVGHQVGNAHGQQLLCAITTHPAVSIIHLKQMPLNVHQPETVHGRLDYSPVPILFLPQRFLRPAPLFPFSETVQAKCHVERYLLEQLDLIRAEHADFTAVYGE